VSGSKALVLVLICYNLTLTPPSKHDVYCNTIRSRSSRKGSQPTTPDRPRHVTQRGLSLAVRTEPRGRRGLVHARRGDPVARATRPTPGAHPRPPLIWRRTYRYTARRGHPYAHPHALFTYVRAGTSSWTVHAARWISG
jgi:hypothetical protein